MDLFKYHVWANRRVLQHLGTLPEDVFTAKCDSSFPSIQATLEHVLTVDKLWLSRITGNEVDVEIRLSSIKDATDTTASLYAQYSTHFERLDSVNPTISYKNSKGVEYTDELETILRHLVNHGTYHRGQIATMLRQLGQKAPATDYIVYVREQ